MNARIRRLFTCDSLFFLCSSYEYVRENMVLSAQMTKHFLLLLLLYIGGGRRRLSLKYFSLKWIFFSMFVAIDVLFPCSVHLFMNHFRICILSDGWIAFRKSNFIFIDRGWRYKSVNNENRRNVFKIYQHLPAQMNTFHLFGTKIVVMHFIRRKWIKYSSLTKFLLCGHFTNSFPLKWNENCSRIFFFFFAYFHN